MSFKKLFGGVLLAFAVCLAPVHAEKPKAKAAVAQSAYVEYEGAYFREDTGEALKFYPAPDSDDDGPAFLRLRVRKGTILAPTGWFFQSVTQQLPDATNLEGERIPIKIAPWNHLSQQSAQRLAGMFAEIWAVPIDVIEGDNNSQFAYSKRPLLIRFRPEGIEPKTVNAGSVAKRIVDAMIWIEPMGPPFHNPQVIDTILRDTIAAVFAK